MTDLVTLIEQVHDQLRTARLSHAFGGALAFGYVGEPRGTVDIDVNVFVAEEEVDRVSDALAPIGYRAPASGRGGPPIAGIRFLHDQEPFPLDVFPSLHERYAEVERRVVRHPFGRDGRRLPFLSAEDVCVFKISFGRPKDWVDLQSIADVGTDLDLDYIEEQAVALRGPSMYPEVAKLRALLRARRPT